MLVFSNYRTYGGTGLGLWISKMIVELMGGSITVESGDMQGSRFIIKLKLKVAKNDSNTTSSNNQLKRTVTLFS